MNDKVRVAAVAVKNNINLPLLANGMGIEGFEPWKGCLELDKDQVIGLLKYPIEDAKVHLYKIGCIVMIGFEEKEEQTILGRLEQFIHIDYTKKMYLFKEYEYCPADEVYAKAEAMARSVRLRWIEAQVDKLMEKSEPLLTRINKGSKKGYTPKVRYLIANMQRFEIESVGVLAMLGRPYHGHSKEAYDAAIKTYLIKERFEIVSKKLKLLKGISSAHELFGRFIGWQRLLIIEAVLLVCFPLPGLITMEHLNLWKRTTYLIHWFISYLGQ